MHNQGYGTICGHGIIGLVAFVLEARMVEASTDFPILKVDTAAGQVIARVVFKRGCVREVAFRNVPSFVYALGQAVDVPGLGLVRLDIAFGGAFYAFCKAEDLNISLSPENFRTLIDLGMRIKKAVINTIPVRHPSEEDLGFIFGTIIVGELAWAESPQSKCLYLR